MNNSGKRFAHLLPVLQALLVTFLWSTSFIIIKWGLKDIPPITYAGLRYFLAFLIFLPFILKDVYVNEIKKLTRSDWKNLFLLGIVFYTFTQGIQFLGLSLLPSVTVSLLLNFTPLVVALLGIFLLREVPTRRQWLGSFLFLAGIFLYFFPLSNWGGSVGGLAVMLVGVLANSGAAVIGRNVNRKKNISPLVVPFISMGMGALLLLLTGLLLDGVPVLSLKNFWYLLWLAGINTAFAFTLWNVTLRSLTAMESSIINGTMLIQIALLAWYFLGETITLQEGGGMTLAAAGAVLVQLKQKTEKRQ